MVLDFLFGASKIFNRGRRCVRYFSVPKNRFLVAFSIVVVSLFLKINVANCSEKGCLGIILVFKGESAAEERRIRIPPIVEGIAG